MSSLHADGRAPIALTVNGSPISTDVEVRRTLADFLRDDLRLTGTHLGCEHGVCGACTVHIDGELVRSCLALAIQADGRDVTTIEGLAVDRRHVVVRCSKRSATRTASSARSARPAS